MNQFRAKLIGKKFGKLTVIEFSHLDKFRHVHWKCKCDCGQYRTSPSRQLLGGRTKSCGCIPRPSGSRNKNWRGVGDLGLATFNKIKIDAKKRHLSFEVTMKQCWKLFLDQNKKCKLSGLPIQFKTQNRIWDGTASLDRIDSSKGYTLDNIQWVHKDVNVMKWDLTLDRFLFLVSQIQNTVLDTRAKESSRNPVTVEN